MVAPIQPEKRLIMPDGSTHSLNNSNGPKPDGQLYRKFKRHFRNSMEMNLDEKFSADSEMLFCDVRKLLFAYYSCCVEAEEYSRFFLATSKMLTVVCQKHFEHTGNDCVPESALMCIEPIVDLVTDLKAQIEARRDKDSSDSDSDISGIDPSCDQNT